MELEKALNQRTATHTIKWKAGDEFMSYLQAAMLVDDAYSRMAAQKPRDFQTLGLVAKDIYVTSLQDLGNGLDYLRNRLENGTFQDAAIRRLFKRNGWRFNGMFYVQVSDLNDDHWSRLAPGRVPFHKPELIEHKEGKEYPAYCEKDSVLDFFLSNKAVRSTSD